MRTLIYAVALLAFVGLSLLGCADKSLSPVAPTDQAVSQPGSLEKKIVREFSGTMDPIEVTDPGTTKVVHGKTVISGVHNKVVTSATFADGGADLFSGQGDVEINAIVDFAAGQGYWWGRAKITPTAREARGGYWELFWYGRSTLGPTGWTLPLNESGYGKGGALSGSNIFLDHIITAPPDISSWHGDYQGTIKSHCGRR